MYKFNTIEEAIQDIKEGKIIIVVDDEDRENEGDLLMAAEKVEGEHINFMATFGKGLICVPAEEELLRKLDINEMVEKILIIMKLPLRFLLTIRIQQRVFLHLKEQIP